MLVLSVRQVDPERAIIRESYPEQQLKFCCLKAARFVTRLMLHSSFPCTGRVCVSVIKIPEIPCKKPVGKLLLHAIRLGTSTDIPVAPAWAVPLLPTSSFSGQQPSELPMSMDLRYASPEMLPDEVRAILPGRCSRST